ncbi:MAG: putative SnoaL-like aldol condensation-catalyzing enzyme [Francisellaceae bacterium]|jgi:predicted SnoaL-like aldol condensation-catalyzing enzyme
MFTKEQAKSFLDDLFENLFCKGQVERLKEFYAEDAVGHYNDSTLNLSDIETRVHLLNNICKHRRYTVTEHIVFDNFIVFKCRQVWLTNTDKKLCGSMIVGTYRIVENKIKELWLMMDDANETYLEINQSETDYLPRCEITNCSKKQFFEYLSDYEYFHQKIKVSLSDQE